MRKILKSAMICLSVLAIFSCTNTPESDSSADPSPNTDVSASPVTQSMSGLMDNMMAEMHKAKMTGDTDYDFAMMMIPHHKGALEMAKLEFSSGKDEELKKIAQDIIISQEKEVTQMETFLKGYKPKSNDMEAPQSREMMKTMNTNVPSSTNNIDRDFVETMIPHHQSAIDMANVQLKYGKNESMRTLATNMIAEQEKENSIFKEWLKKNTRL